MKTTQQKMNSGCELNYYLEVTLELKETHAAHEKNQTRKKFTNKQVNRLWAMKLLKEISLRENIHRSFNLFLKIHLDGYKVEDLLKEEIQRQFRVRCCVLALD